MKHRSFWSANVSELFERIAFYGMTPMLVLYLTEVRGIPSSTAIGIGGNFGLVTYGLAALSGFIADAMGYRRAMILAFSLLTAGYAFAGESAEFAGILASLLMVAVGASLVKPIITGTVQKTCGEAERSVGFSVYYTLVNIGGFLGPNIAAQVRGELGAAWVFRTSAAASAIGLLITLLVYRDPPAAKDETRRSLRDFGRDFLKVLSNGRLVTLFLLVALWWSMFFQFLNVLPLYLEEDLHVGATWMGLILSLDAFAVICLQVPVGYLVRRMTPERAVVVAALVSSVGVALMGVQASAVVAGVGIAIFALGEIIYSAHFYNYLGSLAPAGQVGMYMGFAFLPIALGSFLSGQIGGPVSDYFRKDLGAPQMMWFAFSGAGVLAAAGLAVVIRFGRPDGATSPRS